MKKLLSFAIIALLAVGSIQAQRTACVDIDKVLNSMSEYNNAQSQLDKQASKWRQEIDQDNDVIKGLYSKYQAEQVLMSDEMRTKMEDDIVAKESAVREKQKSYFGPEGALFQRRMELVRPIQERVYNTIEDYAAEKGFDFIFDKGGSAGIIFVDDRYDKTDDILKALQ